MIDVGFSLHFWPLSIAAFRIDEIKRGKACAKPSDAVGDLAGGRGGEGDRGNVRCYQHVLYVPKRALRRQWFGFVDVERRVHQMTFLKQLDESCLVYHGPP